MGFIGSHTVVALYQSGYLPIIIDNLQNSFKFVYDNITQILGVKVPFYELDCNNKTELTSVFLKEGNIEGLIHFAADKAVGESVDKPLKYYQNNLGSLITVLTLMEEHQVGKIVFSSSCTVYGEPDDLPVTELTPKKQATSPYGNTKSMCEEILEDTVKANNQLDVIALRYFNPIGAHPSALIGELPIGTPNNLIPFITQTAIGKRKELTVFGSDYPTEDGSCIRDYIHVSDLAKAHVAALDKKRIEGSYKVYNVGTGNGNSVFEVINTFEKVSGEKLTYKVGDRRLGDTTAVYADASLIQKELNWEAEYSLEEALDSAWKWELSLKEKGSEV